MVAILLALRYPVHHQVGIVCNKFVAWPVVSCGIMLVSWEFIWCCFYSGCTHKGVEHREGSSFKAADGCNTWSVNVKSRFVKLILTHIATFLACVVVAVLHALRYTVHDDQVSIDKYCVT